VRGIIRNGCSVVNLSIKNYYNSGSVISGFL